MIKKKYGWHRINDLGKKPTVKDNSYDDGREQRIIQALAPYARNKPQSNLTPVDIENVTRNTSIAFVLLPEWATKFPPYNVARLAAVAKGAGYKTYAYDLNAKAFRDHKNWEGLDFDPWSGTRDWKWNAPHYMTDLHQFLEPFLLKYVDKIIEDKVTCVGFTLYYCNAEPTKWMVRELKRRNPDIKIIVGGPECHNGYWQPEPEYDYTVTGEGEKLLLEVLEHIESGVPLEKPMHLKQEEGERLDLDSVPAPDYSFFDQSDYTIPNGVNFELSRGCTAKCVFCTETHFWKYRGRVSKGVVDEIIDLYYTRGVDVIWFLDSLVNGNLKELRAFAKGIIASGIKISWTGYARCDERMDLEYLQDLADSGCIALSFGIESGATNVLKDMDKGTTVAEIEQNLRDCKTVGIEGFSTWVTGFPTEMPQDFYETMTMMWRNRNSSLTYIPSGGSGFNISPESIAGQNPKRFHVAPMQYEDNWIRDDLTNSKYHRLIRIKSVAVFLHNMVNERNVIFGDRFGIGEHYQLDLKTTDQHEIEYEQFDFDIIKPNINPMADSLVNEIWPVLRLFWRSRGAYKISIQFNPELDSKEFGHKLSGQFHCAVNFEIDNEGNWKADFFFNFQQREKPWQFLDYLQGKSVGIDRARKLSGLNMEEVDSFDERYRKAYETYNHLDFSFEYQYNDTGKW